MLKQKYVFVGKYNNNEVYYNVKEKELYELIPYDKPINISPSIYAFVSSILYVFLQKFTIRNLAVSMKWYVGLNAAFGLILSIVSIKYLEPAMDKALVKVLVCQEQSEWKKILWQNRKTLISNLYMFIILLLLLLFVPNIIQKTNNAILFYSYFVVWYVFGLLCYRLNLHTRTEISKIIKRNMKQSKVKA